MTRIIKERLSTFLEEPLPDGWATATIGELIAPGGIFIDGDWVESKDQDPLGEVRLFNSRILAMESTGIGLHVT